MKLIFLDLDGVLVTRRPGVMEERLLHNLQGLVARTGAEIVLSSDWRRHPAAREEAKRMLATVGLKIIGHTPCMSAFLAQRPTEIMQWKKDFTKRPGADIVTHWVAIDDRSLLDERHGQYLKGHFVQTHPLRGLTDQAVEDCVRILNQDLPPTPPYGEEEQCLADPLSPSPGGRVAAGGRSTSQAGARGRMRGGSKEIASNIGPHGGPHLLGSHRAPAAPEKVMGSPGHPVAPDMGWKAFGTAPAAGSQIPAGLPSGAAGRARSASGMRAAGMPAARGRR
mmetsp:Transcript_10030/g.21884  ORF Transcript_10030/g.21884 Transcript_10030/m.21884 type:complete len:280 (+) Transcript_10030:135-974(+)